MVTCRELAIERLRTKSIQEVTYRHYLKTLDNLGLSDLPVEELSLQTVISRLGTVLNYGTRRRYIIELRSSLGLNIPIPKVEQKTYNLPPFKDLVAACEGTYEMYGLVMLFAGLRQSEVTVKQPLNGRVLNVDRQRRNDGKIAAAKTTGPVIIPQWLADRYKSFEPNIGHTTLNTGIRRMLKRSGITGLTPHSFRHAFATQLVRTGASPEVLRRQLRHTNVHTSLLYYVQTTDSDIITAVDKLSGGDIDG